MFAGGATRTHDWFDHHDAWLLDLNNMSAGWVATTDIPFASNHLSFVTAVDGSGASRVYFMGGQKKHDEGDQRN